MLQTLSPPASWLREHTIFGDGIPGSCPTGTRHDRRGLAGGVQRVHTALGPDHWRSVIEGHPAHGSPADAEDFPETEDIEVSKRRF